MKNGTTNKERTSISHSTSIVGNIRAEEHLVINGTVKGNIEIKGFSLFIGPSGRLEGDVLAQTVKVRGYMQGKIIAKGVEWTEGTSPTVSHATGREPLGSSGSYRPADCRTSRQCANR